MDLQPDGLYYVYAEYNPFWIYMGWWLYATPVAEVSEDKELDRCERPTWLNYDWRLDALMVALELPALHDYRGTRHTECRAFLSKYPAGALCHIRDGGRYFIKQDCECLGDYLRRIRERQLLHIAKAREGTTMKLSSKTT
jgi:hypothetical protein